VYISRQYVYVSAKRILFYFQPNSNRFRTHSGAVHDERAEWTSSWHGLCSKMWNPFPIEVETLWVSTWKKDISFGNIFDWVKRWTHIGPRLSLYSEKSNGRVEYFSPTSMPKPPGGLLTLSTPPSPWFEMLAPKIKYVSQNSNIWKKNSICCAKMWKYGAGFRYLTQNSKRDCTI